MSFAFEAATISISIGVVVSVLLQGRLLDRQDPQRVPPRAAFALQAVDVWLAVVFALVIFVTIAVAFDAIARGKPLVAADRRVIEHLLTLAAVYPALIAIGRRMLPILFSAPAGEAPYALPRLELPVLLLPLLGLFAAALLLQGLLDPSLSLNAALLRIALAGVVVVGPCLAAPLLATWWSRRVMRRVRFHARDRRLIEQTVTGSLPDDVGEITARVYRDRSTGTTPAGWT